MWSNQYFASAYTPCASVSLCLCVRLCACLTYTDVVSTVVVSAAVKSHQSLGERHVWMMTQYNIDHVRQNSVVN